MAIKVVGIVGSYRKGKTIDSAVSAILEGAKGTLKKAAKVMGAKVIKSLYFGPVAGREDSQSSEKALRKARKAGEEFARQVRANR